MSSAISIGRLHQPLGRLGVESLSDSLFEDQDFCEADDRVWWVLYTMSRQEKALGRYLRMKRVPYYLPLHRAYSLCRGRRTSSLVPLFSSYIFLFADPHERVVALTSNRVARVITVPSARQRELADNLLAIQQLITSGVPLTVESRIQEGARVRVRSGRLAGVEGVVITRRRRSQLLVAVDFLQQGASIEIDDFALEVV